MYCYGDLVTCRYLTSVFRAGAEELLDAFKKEISELNQRNIQQISTDGPPVNVRFLNFYEMERSQKVLNIGSCSLHTVCDSLKTADQAVWEVGQFLALCYYVFHDSRARRARFLEWNDI